VPKHLLHVIRRPEAKFVERLLQRQRARPAEPGTDYLKRHDPGGYHNVTASTDRYRSGVAGASGCRRRRRGRRYEASAETIPEVPLLDARGHRPKNALRDSITAMAWGTIELEDEVVE
jgi:hypothetical protein